MTVHWLNEHRMRIKWLYITLEHELIIYDTSQFSPPDSALQDKIFSALDMSLGYYESRPGFLINLKKLVHVFWNFRENIHVELTSCVASI